MSNHSSDIVDAYAASGNLRSVAREFGIAEKSVRLALNRAGVFERGAFRRELTPYHAAYVPPGAVRPHATPKLSHVDNRIVGRSACDACEMREACRASVARRGQIGCELQEAQ